MNTWNANGWVDSEIYDGEEHLLLFAIFLPEGCEMIDCADVVDACLEKFGQHELEGMSEPEQIVTLLFNLEYDIVSSGTSNFLWRGQFVQETLSALRRVELYSVAFNLERLLALHQKRRHEELTQADELLKRELEKFFYQTEGILHERICTYIERKWPEQ